MLLVARLGIISILMGGLRTILPGEIINRSDKDLQDQRPHITCPVPNREDVGYKKQMSSWQHYIFRCVIPIPVVICPQHCLISLSEGVSPLLINNPSVGFPVLPRGSSHVTGWEMMSLFRSDRGWGEWMV